jgi:methionyl-tRNA formyltransferase
MLRVLFAGTPECAIPSLEAVARKHQIVAVLTNPPSAQGRSPVLVPTPVALAAERLKEQGLIGADIPILTPEKINDEARALIAAQKPDIMACFAFGKIFGPKTLALFPLGAINLHPSLLPRWRGCAPVPAAILARDQETGITIQKMALEMDAGDIILQKTIPLNGTETADELLERTSHDGAPMMVEALDHIEMETACSVTQDAGMATYCAMIRKEEAEIDWKRSAHDIDAQIRAFTPWPGTFTRAGDQTLLILKAHVSCAAHAYAPDTDIAPLTDGASVGAAPAGSKPGTVIGIDKKEGILVQTGDGILTLERLQWRTRKPLDWKTFLNGSRDFINTELGKGI